MTSAGCSLRIRSSAAARQASHSRYSRPKLGLHTAASSGGQVALLNTTRRQPRASASGSTAGNHAAACESPNSTTVEVGDDAPYTQSSTRVWLKLAKQPSAKGLDRSPCAWRIDGVRFAGTSPSARD